jgi:signal transduction histidine kinase/ligand-binding sensor domain-containing protein
MSARTVCRVAAVLWLGLALFPSPAACAQETNTAWLNRPWQSDDGLPDDSVAGVAQTRDGFLWLGTPSGLVRFDGLRFETFPLTNVIAPPNKGIILMQESARGGLWLVMDRGAVVYLNADASRAYTNGLSTTIAYEMAEDAGGALWVAYHDGHVYRIANGQVTPITARQNLPPGDGMCALTADERGQIWFAKAGQIGRFQDGAFQTLCRLPPQLLRLAAAKGGGVWISSGSQLWKCDEKGQLQSVGVFHPGNGSATATVLLEDHEGAVWIGTSFSGLYRYDGSGFEAIPTSHQGILSVVEDREGNIWVGTFGGGLDRIRRRAMTLEGQESGLPFASVQSICEGTDGSVWAVTQSGVVVHKVGGKWNPLSGGDRWPMGANCVAAGPDGSVWIGTRQHGLYCWRDGQFVNWGDAAQLQAKTLHTLLVARNGDVWIGQEAPSPESPSAVLRLRAGRITTFPAPPDSRIIRAMAEDAAGNIWAGTSKGVLLRITGDQMAVVSPRPSQELASIRCLYATPDGSLWMGYAGWGVGRLRGGHYAEFNTGQGLYNDYISHIVADGQGWLWFGSNRGIFKVRLRDFQDVATNRLSQVRSVHYGRGEGLPSLQGTFGDSPNVLRGRDGRLWFPMQTALVVVDPAKLHRNAEPPPVLLTQVIVDDHVAARYRGILPADDDANSRVLDLMSSNVVLRLPAGHHRIEFDFAALSFNAPENMQFRYRLKNYDDDWVETGARRSPTYSRIPGGKYVFEMTACNNDGDWSPNAARLAVAVAPFFWNTWTFRLTVLAAFTASIIAIVRYISFRRLHRRLRVLEQQAALQKERARIAKDIHDDLGANLTQIAFMSELAQQDLAAGDEARVSSDETNPPAPRHPSPDTRHPKVSERVGRISGTARQAIKSLDEIVWAVNPRNDTLAHLVDYAGQFALDYLRLAGIRCRLDFPEQIPQRELSTDLRHNLFLVLKEATHNIVKHAHATEVWLRARFSEQAVDVVIEDNGCGFDPPREIIASKLPGEANHSISRGKPPDNAFADGLRNMRQRMSDIGGECHFESQPGGGTRVLLHLPWPGEGDT